MLTKPFITLQGDYTRTGERKFTGLMKDGMNSANRYIYELLPSLSYILYSLNFFLFIYNTSHDTNKTNAVIVPRK